MIILIRRLILGIFLLAMFFVSLGCYTVLKKPGRVMPEEDRHLGEGYYTEDWAGPGHLWYDPFYNWYYPDVCGRWRYYYTCPWWWNDHRYWHSGEDEGIPVDTERHIWDRRRGPGWSSPPSSPGTPSSASRPSQKKGKVGEKPVPADSQKDQERRMPDWGRKPSDRSSPELKSKDRGQQEERKVKGEEQ
jgi:hypothetical protein